MQKTIDWLYWQMLDSVEPWQAAALAAGMNPDALLHERHSWMSYPGAVIFQDKSFSGADEKERFEKLWNLAKSRADAHQRVALSEFASFLVSHEWPGVPEPLRMMAKGAAPVMQQPEPHPAPAAQVEQPRAVAQIQPVQRSAAQDAAILNAIREAGHDPLTLPKNDSGKRGIKAVIREELKGKHTLFPKFGRQFDKAWERLRARKEIDDSE